jgi:DNA-binding NarL/FixJ family response regulator
MIRLLIAEDHAIVRNGLKKIFMHMPEIAVAGEAVNGAEVLERLQQDKFDVLLTDLNMPGISGAELIVRVKAQYPDLPILVLSMHNEPHLVAGVLKAGANGYITKDCEPDVLLTAIRKVAAHERYVAPDLAERMVFSAHLGAEAPTHARLSQRELEVLRLLTAGHSINAIATQLYISNKTVSTHKMRLMEKLNVTSMAALMQYVIQNGLFDTNATE